MAEKINGTEMIMTLEESKLFERQAQAQASGDVTKAQAEYQNEPNDGDQCSQCSMFVPGFPEDVAGYCTKVRSFRGPQGLIFEDGWCKFFSAKDDDEEEDS